MPTAIHPNSRNLRPECIAAFNNFAPNWHRNFTKLGLKIVMVWIQAHRDSPIHNYPKLEQSLDLALRKVGAGSHDSSHWPGCYDTESTGSVWHIFHASDLSASMICLKNQLAARGTAGRVGHLPG
ncbi:MAG: hypothetical protein V9H26_19610 [Verrucomicrobiota bacterium]